MQRQNYVILIYYDESEYPVLTLIYSYAKLKEKFQRKCDTQLEREEAVPMWRDGGRKKNASEWKESITSYSEMKFKEKKNDLWSVGGGMELRKMRVSANIMKKTLICTLIPVHTLRNATHCAPVLRYYTNKTLLNSFKLFQFGFRVSFFVRF